jgi:hypothetical protein
VLPLLHLMMPRPFQREHGNFDRFNVSNKHPRVSSFTLKTVNES